MGKLLLAFLAIGAGVAIWWGCKSCNPPKPPHYNPDEWWGPKEMKGKVDTSVRPFQVKFDEMMVKDLKERLNKHRSFTPPLEGVGFEYGFNSAQLDTWVNYWSQSYNFVEREKFLNQFPQFKTNIQGLDIHFIRVRPHVPVNIHVVPILLLHGWPGSVREFYETIPLLTKQREGFNFAFEVIVPSLPGYGFSDVSGTISSVAAVRPGLSSTHMGVIFRNLMHRLGFKYYYVQGGDWGAGISSAMATLYPDEVLGLHSNMLFAQTPCTMLATLIGSIFPSFVVESHLADRIYPLSNLIAHTLEEFGYMHLQATKPDTVGVALSDSPSGLLAYILEKFSTWTNKEFKTLKDGGLAQKFTKDQLIDNLMFYWSTNSITTSMRLYAETLGRKSKELMMDEELHKKHGHRDHDHDKHDRHGHIHHDDGHGHGHSHRHGHHGRRSDLLHGIPTPVPTWGIQARHELFYQPPWLLKKKYPNLLNTTVLDFGGHFFAFEEPKIFSEDVFKAVKAFQEFRSNKQKTEL